MDLALATHEEGEQGAEEEANPMALPPESALVLSLLQQMEDEQFEADEQAAVAEVRRRRPPRWSTRCGGHPRRSHRRNASEDLA